MNYNCLNCGKPAEKRDIVRKCSKMDKDCFIVPEI